jgi:hypothetical protein
MTTIHTVATDNPELALLAAVIQPAADDARTGNREAREWLASPQCRDILSWLIPPEAELDAVHSALLGMAKPRKPWQGRLRLLAADKE